MKEARPAENLRQMLARRFGPKLGEGRNIPAPKAEAQADRIDARTVFSNGRIVDVTALYALPWLIILFLLTLIILFVLLRFGAGVGGIASVTVAFGLAAGLVVALTLILRRKRLSDIFAGGAVTALIGGALPSALPNASFTLSAAGWSATVSLGVIDQAISFVVGLALAALLSAIAWKIRRSE